MAFRLENFGIYENNGVVPLIKDKFIIRLWVHQHNFSTNKVELTEDGTIISVANSIDEAVRSLPDCTKNHDENVKDKFGLRLISYSFLIG